jgi:hypothetical protein
VKRLALVLPAALLLPGCFVVALGAAGIAIMASQNRDPISIQDGVATRDYAISFNRCWAAVESSLRSFEVQVEPVKRDGDVASVAGVMKDGQRVEVSAAKLHGLTHVGVRVGAEDTEDNRNSARRIHHKIDEDFQVVRRHWARTFDPVWDASQKSGVQVDSRVQPDNTLGQIQGKLADGTGVIITIQKIEESRTRITIEVGTAASPETSKQAVDLARQISLALGIKSEEGD